MALTAAQYKAEMDNGLAQYSSTVSVSTERAVLWAQVASVGAHLWTHQSLFDRKDVVGSATAQGYRTKAEAYLKQAKGWATSTAAASRGIAAINAASVAAYAYCQTVKAESDVV